MLFLGQSEPLHRKLIFHVVNKFYSSGEQVFPYGASLLLALLNIHS